MGIALREIGYSLRSLRNTPDFLFVAVGALALSIAANIVVFCVVDAALLHSLPYPHADRIAILHLGVEHGQSSVDISASAFYLVKNYAHSFENAAAIYPAEAGVNLAGTDPPQYVKALRISKDFFDTVETTPIVGRVFQAGEDQTGSPHVAIISYKLWVGSFDKNLSVLGYQIKINGESYAIVGVMPPQFRSYPDADLWIPLQLSETSANPGNDYRVIVRLKDGITKKDAQQELDLLSKQHRLTSLNQAQAGKAVLTLEDFHHFIAGGVSKNLSILFGAVVFVLLIACTNIGILLLVRAMERTNELAIRVALGASRGRIIRMFLLESFCLAIAGGTLGMICAKELLHWVLRLVPADLSFTEPIEINGRVALFAVGISVLTPILFGLAPALRMSSSGLNELLRQASLGVGLGIKQTHFGRILVSIQTALTLVLLVGTILLLKNFLDLLKVPPGFDTSNVTAAQILLAADRYGTTAATSQLFDRVASQLQNSPGVESIVSVDGLPLETGLNLPAYPDDARKNIVHTTEYRIVSEDYFHTLRIPLLEGRFFTNADNNEAAPVVIINETLWHRWWGQMPAAGHYTTVGEELGTQFSDVPRQIVGVVADVHEFSIDRPAPPTIFIPLRQAPDKIATFVNKLFLTTILVRSVNKVNVNSRVRAALKAADPDLPIASLRPLTQVIRVSIARPQFYATLTGAFGGFALLLTAIGLYGLLSYQVELRTTEIAMRIALGARKSQVLALVVREGLKPVLVGSALGLVGAFFLTQLLKSMLYNFKRIPLEQLAFAVILLGMVAVLASLLTALRAVSLEPMVVLRNE